MELFYNGYCYDLNEALQLQNNTKTTWPDDEETIKKAKEEFDKYYNSGEAAQTIKDIEKQIEQLRADTDSRFNDVNLAISTLTAEIKNVEAAIGELGSKVGQIPAQGSLEVAAVAPGTAAANAMANELG